MSEVRLEVDAGVALLTLDAPARGNALTVAMARELAAALDRVDDDPGIGALVMAPAGPRFCAGAHRDLLAEVGRDPLGTTAYEALGTVYDAFYRVGCARVPVVAAVRGAAVGAGVNLALAADVRLVTPSTRIVPGFAGIGLHPGGGHLTLLDALAGRQAAAALALLGGSLTGEDAVRTGLAWELVDDDHVVERALGLAAVAGADPALARRTTRSLRLASSPTPSEWARALEAERGAQLWSLHRAAATVPGAAR